MKATTKLVGELGTSVTHLRDVEIFESSDSNVLGEARKRMEEDAKTYLTNPKWVSNKTIFGGHFKGDNGHCVILE